MAPTLPTSRVYPTQAVLNEKFASEGWAERVQAWAVKTSAKDWDPSHPLRRASRVVHETRRKYVDQDGNTRAVLILYREIDGTERLAVRMLRDDDGAQFDVEVEAD